jgi:hypothetical protein
VPYVRTVKTASGATAVQIVHSSYRGSRDIEHVGSAHDDAELELLKAAARQRLAAGQGELDLSLDTAAAGGPLPITGSRMGCLLDALQHAHQVLGFDQAAGGDEVFGQLADHPRRRHRAARALHDRRRDLALRTVPVLPRPPWEEPRQHRLIARYANLAFAVRKPADSASSEYN